MINKGMFTSNKHDYSTPQDFFDKLNAEFHFTLDPCATAENAKCKRFFTPEQDGLAQWWNGNVFMNPPYGREIGRWMKKAYEECILCHNCTVVVCLVPSRTDTRWWHEYATKANEIRFHMGRLKFDGKNPAPFPSAVVIYRC